MKAILKLSENLLSNIKHELSYSEEISKLSALNYNDLITELTSDDTKKAFWINIYNAFYQILYLEIQDNTIYKQHKIAIAGYFFSLDTIEHGILRKGKFVIGFGFLYNPFYPNFIKKLRVTKLDYKIHFALNCGAVSCPPILVYKSDLIVSQLNLATHSFIESESDIDYTTKTIFTSKLFLWYYRDFGSVKTIKQITGTVFNQDFSNFTLKHKPYNWTKQLRNFK